LKPEAMLFAFAKAWAASPDGMASVVDKELMPLLKDALAHCAAKPFLIEVDDAEAPEAARGNTLGGQDYEAFLAGGDSGEDCEHVPHHRRMREAGYQMWLNPGCRYIAAWHE
jgi:hypothetical protein